MMSRTLVKRMPEGRMKRSYFGGLRVKPSPTNVAFVMTRFHDFFMRLPLFITRKISSSAIGRTLGSGTSHLPAFSLRFCLIVLLRTLARAVCERRSGAVSAVQPCGAVRGASSKVSSLPIND
jgi:hypothetical protein